MEEKNSKDNRSLSVLIEELAMSINSKDDIRNKELIQQIKQRNDENKKNDKIFEKFLIVCFCLFVFSVVGNLLLFDRNDQMEREMADSKWKDSLFNAIMEPDSNMTIRYGVHGDGKVVTYHQLEHQKDSISKKYEDEKWKNQLTSVTHVNKEQYYEVLLENEKLKDRLEVIKETYKIRIKEDKNGYRLISPEIDSALILLPHYRNMLKYNPKEHSWSIRIVK